MDKNEIIERLERLARCAVHTVGELPFVMSLDDGIAIHEAIDMLRSQPEPHWILCSERLPENRRQVLVYARSVHYALAKYDEMREADGTYKKQWVTFDAWKPYYTIKEVIAWMPLPEPYKGGEGKL